MNKILHLTWVVIASLLSGCNEPSCDKDDSKIAFVKSQPLVRWVKLAKDFRTARAKRNIINNYPGSTTNKIPEDFSHFNPVAVYWQPPGLPTLVLKECANNAIMINITHIDTDRPKVHLIWGNLPNEQEQLWPKKVTRRPKK